MAYAEPFLRLVVSGSLFGVERFSYGMSLVTSFNNPPLDEPTEVPQAIIDALSAFHNTANFPIACALDTIKLNLIGEDGRYVNQDTVLYEYETPVIGTASTAPPAQVAWAVTLGTAASRGLASRGRFFLPTPTVAIGADGRVSESAALARANQVAQLVADITAAVPGFSVGVVSNVGAGARRPVTHVEMGRVLDTMRSRRRSLDEARVVATTSAQPT